MTEPVDDRERDVDGKFAPRPKKVTKGNGGRFKKGQKRPAKAGRRKGTPNKVTREWKEFVLWAIKRPESQEAILRRMMDRPELFFRAAEHAIGKPKETQDIEIDGTLTVKWED